ncbi:hypothetical protein [Streptomyces sp. NPDC014995]|uniref:SCO2400 family protein n=1 Tax=Streptomyces sp. NPDC014995 TaxID=3364936 RepID=UPI0036FF58F0
MDYCSTCRRHLNGALVCPGCGAYAPDIAPPIAGGPGGPVGAAASATTLDAPGATAAPEPTVASARQDGSLRDDAELAAGMNDVPGTGPSGDIEGAPVARQGRAARRRQLARWKKNQRRAVVATAVALMGGGLTVASMDRHSTDRAQAATGPDDGSTGAAAEGGTERDRPESTPPSYHRSSRSAARAHPSATHAPAQQPLAATPDATPQTTRPDAAMAPRLVAPSAPRPQSTPPSSDATAPDRTDTAEQQTPPSPTDSRDAGTAQTSPAPASTSPTDVCLLVLCLG